MYVPKSLSLALLIKYELASLITLPSLWISIGSSPPDPLYGIHEKLIVNPTNDALGKSCPHVRYIVFKIILGGFSGGCICGLPNIRKTF